MLNADDNQVQAVSAGRAQHKAVKQNREEQTEKDCCAFFMHACMHALMIHTRSDALTLFVYTCHRRFCRIYVVINECWRFICRNRASVSGCDHAM